MNAHNLRRRVAWPRAAGQQRRRAEEIAKDQAEHMRETLHRLADLKTQSESKLVGLLTEIELDVAMAILGFEDIRRMMEEAALAAATPGGSQGSQQDETLL